MFIIPTNPAEEAVPLLRRVKRAIGHIPPHFELFATLNPKRFEMFINEIFYLSMHTSINPDFFAALRFYISAQNSFTYCYDFNKKLLLSKGYSDEAIDLFEQSADALPMDEKHQALFTTAILAINEPDAFDTDRHEAIKKLGWSEADIYDAIDHAAFLFRFSKILRAYSETKKL